MGSYQGVTKNGKTNIKNKVLSGNITKKVTLLTKRKEDS
jgi:hypothetical protein